MYNEEDLPYTLWLVDGTFACTATRSQGAAAMVGRRRRAGGFGSSNRLAQHDCSCHNNELASRL